MSIGIYKIENVINHKIYIGQSIHIEKRWQEHCQASASSVIGKAIKKYGKSNFTFKIIEECSIEELNEKEEYYINYFNSVVPYGYNVLETSQGRNTIYSNYDKEVFEKIIYDIKNTELSFKEIASKYNLDLSMIYYLNRGEYHTLKEEKYPLREVQDLTKKEYFCVDCGIKISKGATRCEKCGHIFQRTCNRPTRDELKDMIRTLPFTTIGQIYNVSDNAIRKWCIAENLPKKKSEIKKYSDEEWTKI